MQISSNFLDFGRDDGAEELLGVLFDSGEEGSVAVVVFGQTVGVAVGAVAASTTHSQQSHLLPTRVAA